MYAAPSARLGHLAFNGLAFYILEADCRRSGLYKASMERKMVVPDLRRVAHDLCQMNSALMV